VISRDVRQAVDRAVAATGSRAADPGLRPTGTPGQYASSVAFTLGDAPRAIAARLARHVRDEPWIATAEVTGPGFLTITVTPEALAILPERIIAAGPGCATSTALHGQTFDQAPGTDPLAAQTWEEARQALAARVTARLAAAAGAALSIAGEGERVRPTPPANQSQVSGESSTRSSQPIPGPSTAPQPRPLEVAAAVAYAGPDAVTFWLARAAPGEPPPADPGEMARHRPENPAYAVRYAHARAASGLRWAASRDTGTRNPGNGNAAAVPWCPSANQGELALLDALSWLPERVVTAARRRRPDEFARYLEELARAVLAAVPRTDRLALALAARTGLAAGLDLLGVGAPDRL
jgi:arginyl-tRNA synthetase